MPRMHAGVGMATTSMTTSSGRRNDRKTGSFSINQSNNDQFSSPANSTTCSTQVAQFGHLFLGKAEHALTSAPPCGALKNSNRKCTCFIQGQNACPSASPM
eukprot:1143684-Pelagomonas_calceolata.AAC.4